MFFIRNRHQKNTAATRLKILFGGIDGQSIKLIVEPRHKGLINGLNGDDIVLNPHNGCLLPRILDTHIRRVFKGHHHSLHAVRTQRINGYR